MKKRQKRDQFEEKCGRGVRLDADSLKGGGNLGEIVAISFKN